MWSICQKEWKQFFSNLTGYISIILFLLVNGLVLFVLEGNLLDSGYSGLDSFFDLAPWVLIFLIPAISMRSFSDEFRAGTFEILRTRPLSHIQITMGKYFAVVLILVMVLLPTLLYVFTIHSLSVNGIDAGGLGGSYIGLVFLGSVFASISLFCSSLTSNAVVAFLTSVFACVLLYYGFTSLSRLPVFSGNADYYIEMLGIDFHYRSMSRGVIDSRDVIYLLSVIFLFIISTVKNLERK
jgi:ABC-2 type transport system permease protein